jgi:rare lipoprotein A
VFAPDLNAHDDPLPPNRALRNECASSRPSSELVRGSRNVPSIAADNEEYEMRTYIFSALAALTFGLLTLTPASAENAPWTCMSPAFACGGAPVAKSHRSREFAGERTYRRQASGKRTRNRVAKNDSAEKRVTRVERKEQQAAKPQAKVELPERKQAQAPAVTEQSKNKAIAERKVETEKAYRTTSSQSGMASYYGSESGSQTASGARFNPSAMTAAHRTLPFGTKVRVTNKRNGKTVVVTINDRGPFIRGRIIDLSTAAAGVIGMRSSGVAPVVVERIATN